MPTVGLKVWTARRKWMGNLVPIALALPPAVFGVWTIVSAGQVSTSAVLWISAMPVLGWLAVNRFGLFENSAMREQMRRRLMAAKEDLGQARWFVGFSRPGHSGLLDAHEDVGFLIEREDALEFIGDTHRVRLPRASITRVRFRPNPHALLLLGRWVSVEGLLEGQPVRLLVEPRERDTMLGNRVVGKALRKRIEAWITMKGSGA